MTKQDDAKLVQASLRGDLQAFEQLIVLYQRPLFNLAYRLTGVREDAEDIVQAVLVKSFEHLGSYDPRYKFFSWVYRMTVNETINFLRVRQKGQSLSESMASELESPEEVYEQRELSRQIDEALGSLTLDYRVVVVLKHFVDLSYSEIAQVLEIPEKTVKSRLYTARQLMCRVLQDKGVISHD
jgi:RNA polymerase sigma-70 factor (ECF subfamily)